MGNSLRFSSIIPTISFPSFISSTNLSNFWDKFLTNLILLILEFVDLYEFVEYDVSKVLVLDFGFLIGSLGSFIGV